MFDWFRFFRRKPKKSFVSDKLPAGAKDAFFVCVFSMLGKLAALDGRVRKAEREAVRRYIDEKLQLQGHRRRLAWQIFDEGAESPVDLRDYAIRFHKAFPERVQLHDTLVDVLLQVAVADGVLRESENRQIRSVALLLNLSTMAYDRLRSRYTTEADSLVIEQQYLLLGVSVDATDEQIQEGYRKHVSLYHPEKAAIAGVPEEFLELCRERLKEVEAAYESIKRERGFEELLN